MKRDDESLYPEYHHLALLVDEHLVVVGFGDFARNPLPLDGTLTLTFWVLIISSPTMPSMLLKSEQMMVGRMIISVG